MIQIVRLLPLLLVLSACQSPTPPTSLQPPPPPEAPPPVVTGVQFQATDWNELPQWSEQSWSRLWPALLQSCRSLVNKPEWQGLCVAAAQQNPEDLPGLQAFFEERLTPYKMRDGEKTTGLVTGYYEPLLQGSRVRSERFRFPIYGVPDDLLEIDFTSLYPQLKGMRLRGRLLGRKVVPYPDRAAIEQGIPGLQGRELFWVEDPVALFFLQIQGSGRIALPDGTIARVGYADQNGHPYVSIGKKLVEMGELKLEEASMQGIQAWGQRNPAKLPGLLALNPSFVFFRELPANQDGPPGALGVPLTAEYSIAVDPKFIPLGAPVFLATTQPNSTQALNRLVFAQDTGGAIRGALRADFFWGFGEEAGQRAGRMKQAGEFWLLWPKGMMPPTSTSRAPD